MEKEIPQHITVKTLTIYNKESALKHAWEKT